MNYTIYHNPRCGKSRNALRELQEKGVKYDVVEYLKDTPSFEELKDLLMKLNIKPVDLIRKKEEEFKPYKTMEFTDDEWIQIMVEHPKLIERPIIVKGNTAKIARTPESISEILS